MVINGITVDVGSEFQAGVSRDELISTLHHAAFDSGFSLEIRTSRKIPPAKAARTDFDESIDMYCSWGIMSRGNPDRSEKKRKNERTWRKTKKDVDVDDE